jgi:hypothetical protein
MDPPPKLFLDGRLDMYGEQILEDYSKIVMLDKDMDMLLDTYGIEWVLFPPGTFTRYLKVTGSWQVLYHDDQVSVLERIAPALPR